MPDHEEPEMVPLVSTNLGAAGYDDEDEVLIVEFRNGARYAYDAPRSEFEALQEAASPGGYFARNIKTRYEGRRVG